MGIVTCSLKGRTGNQIFQIASTISYGLRYGLEYIIPNYLIRPQFENQKVFFSANLKYTDKEYEAFRGVVTIYDEPFFHFKEIPKFDCEVLVLNGYFQSYKFFNDYKEEILGLLGLNNIEKKEDTCSIHYRSTDYKNLPTKHPVISKAYLMQAIGIMYDEGYKKFLVFSDEIDGVKEIFSSANGLLKTIEIEYSENKSEIEDLKCMASCSANITANSSFSWWGAYINPNPEKIVIMPQRWFGKDMGHNTKDLYLENAIVI